MKNKNILIIGGTGSLGQALIQRLTPHNAVTIVSRDELKQWTIRNELPPESPVSFSVCDMRDRQRLEEVVLTTEPHIIIIAAALKQVDTCERAPSESIKTNILGVQNLVEVVERNMHRLGTLESVVMVSTDKACEPTNVYGMSKAIAERVVTSRGTLHERPHFVAVRYGNVLDSRGSIIPLFRYQAERAPAFTLTHEDMTRFVMTLDQSIDLILDAAEHARSGETWLPKLQAMRVKDLGEIFSRRYNKPVKLIGIRPGEKVHEMLISRTESFRLTERNGYYVLFSPLHPVPADAEMMEYESSRDLLSQPELEAYLDGLGLIGTGVDRFVGIKADELRKN